MFLPLASTMSVFNCWAVGVCAEKTSTRSRKVCWGGWGGQEQRSTQRSCRAWKYRNGSSLVFVSLLKVRAGELMELLLCEVWSADERLLGFPSLLVQSDEISSLDQFFLLLCLSQVALTAPDLVQLQWSWGGSVHSGPFILHPQPPLSVSSLSARLHLWLDLFLSTARRFSVLSSARCCGCCAARSADYRGWIGESGEEMESPRLPAPFQHNLQLSPREQPMTSNSFHDWLMKPGEAHARICNKTCGFNWQIQWEWYIFIHSLASAFPLHFTLFCCKCRICQEDIQHIQLCL